MRKIVFEKWKKNRELVLAWSCGVLFALQIFNFHSYVVLAVDHQGIVATNDDDAAWNVRKTLKTRWWKDNGWILYGPGYFRLNHTIQYLWGRTAAPAGETDHEVWERTAHHAILTVSLLSLALLSLIIACRFLGPWWQRFLFSFGLMAAFTSVPSYSEFILRAHPDLLFALVSVAALAFTIRMLEEPASNLWFWLSASLWGISASVKLTVGLCAPGFVLLFVPPFSRANVRRGIRYLGVMFAAYFLIGFPQTIVLDRPFKAMAKISSLNAPATMESMFKWIKLYGAQAWPLTAVFLLALIDFDRRERAGRRAVRGMAWRAWAFAVLPLLLLLNKNMLVPADHYTVAFWPMLMLVAAEFLPERRFLRFKVGEHALMRAGLFLAVILLAFGATPKTLQRELEARLECREQARDTYNRVKALYEQGRKIWVDPYVPYPTDAPESMVELSWEKSWDGFNRGGWTALALNHGTIQNFTGPTVSDYTRADIPGWEKAREFYSIFAGEGDRVTTPQGQVFTRVYQNACGHEIWLKDN